MKKPHTNTIKQSMKKPAALLASAILASACSLPLHADISVGPGQTHTVPLPNEVEANVSVTGGTIDGLGTLIVTNTFTGTHGSVVNAELDVTGHFIKNSGGTLFLPDRLLIATGEVNKGLIEATGMRHLNASLQIGTAGEAYFNFSSLIASAPLLSVDLDGMLTYEGSPLMGTNANLHFTGGSGYALVKDFFSIHGVAVTGSTPGVFNGTIHFDHSVAGRDHGSTADVFANADVILTNDSYLFVHNEEVGSLAGDDTAVFKVQGEIFIGGNGTNTVFNGYIDRQGLLAGIIKTGTGTMVFGGSTAHLNDVVVLDGALLTTDTAYIWSDVVVLPGSPRPLFGGEGYVDGSLFSDGAVLAGMPGSPGTLYVDNDYVQGPDASFAAQFFSKKRNSSMVVYDDVFLNGGTFIPLTSRPSTLPRKYKAAVITSEFGDVFGAFADARSIGRFTPKLTYTDDQVLVSFSASTFSSLSCLTGNGKAIARQLDRMDKKNGGSARKLIDRIDDATFDREGALCSMINTLLSPEQLTAIFRAGFAAGQTQAINLERHLEYARQDAGYVYEGQSLNITNKYGSIQSQGGVFDNGDGLTLAGFDGKTIVNKNVAPILVPSRWSFFVNGTGEWGDIESTRDARGSDLQTGGVSVGADYRVSENFLVGLIGGYNHTTSKLWDDGRLRVNGGRGGAYASVFNESAYLNLMATGGYNSYDTRRTTFGGQARGKTNGGEFNALISGGYDFECNGLTFGPIGGVQYTYLDLKSFKEHDSFAPMHFPKQSQNSLRSTLGARVAYDWEVCGVKVTPEVRAQWLHEYLDSTASIDSRFAAGGAVFTTRGARIGRNGLLLDAGVSVQVTPHCAVYAYYTGDLGRENYSSNGVNGGVRVQF